MKEATRTRRVVIEGAIDVDRTTRKAVGDLLLQKEGHNVTVIGGCYRE